MTEPRGWRWQAACAAPGMNPDLWFPERDLVAEGAYTSTAAKAARDVCASCPVRWRCLEEALADEGACGVSSRHGIRAGLDPAERLRIYKNRVEWERRERLSAAQTGDENDNDERQAA